MKEPEQEKCLKEEQRKDEKNNNKCEIGKEGNVIVEK